MTAPGVFLEVVIVTGGGRGLGAATCELFARQGAKVVIVARSGDEIEALAEKLRGEEHDAIAIQADVSNPEECEMVVRKTMEHYKYLNVVVNNAAVAHPFQRIEEVDARAWAKAVEINLMGSFYMTRFALPHTAGNWFGAGIINVSSGLAFRARVGQSAYCVSKAGLEMLRKALALETEELGVMVCSYDPGMIDTPMQAEQRELDAATLRVDTEIFHTAYREGRLRDPAYAAQGIMWLARNTTNKKVHGQHFSINDGEFRDTIERELGLAQ